MWEFYIKIVVMKYSMKFYHVISRWRFDEDLSLNCCESSISKLLWWSIRWSSVTLYHDEIFDEDLSLNCCDEVLYQNCCDEDVREFVDELLKFCHSISRWSMCWSIRWSIRWSVMKFYHLIVVMKFYIKIVVMKIRWRSVT